MEEDGNAVLVVELIKEKLKICGMYRKPDSNMDKFLMDFDALLDKYRNMIIMGDFNINLLNTSSLISSKYNNIINTSGFFVLNNISTEYVTRLGYQQGEGSIIDHVITDIFEGKHSLVIKDAYFTDHKYLLLSSDIHLKKDSFTATKTIIDYSKIGEGALLNIIENCNDFSKYIFETIQVINENKVSFPVSTKRFKRRKPWMTSEVIELIKLRDKYFTSSRKQRTNQYNLMQFKYYRNKVDYLCKISKKQYYSEQLSKNIHSSSRMWKTINEVVFGRNSSKFE